MMTLADIQLLLSSIFEKINCVNFFSGIVSFLLVLANQKEFHFCTCGWLGMVFQCSWWEEQRFFEFLIF